ncbi:MAG: bifunctional glutamate N-acetyltransferase/amino-acid acetyltransferase ArgJ [Anaerolineae bacterium]|nr:bifunctional glutamate N-acetyltransferase/amino-acid acetyltransferase ArgJ [Anaerolineae bacterium]
MEQVKGFKVAGVHCGLKDNGALDFALIVSDRPCTAAAIFTTNKVKAAPVLYDMEAIRLNNTHIRAIAVNTRCANACTGEQGIANSKQMAKLTAEALGVGADEVIVMSTGVIGTQLPMDKIAQAVRAASDSLGNNWNAAAHAIMTTDTRPKMASVTVTTSDGRQYTVAGIAKGAGMIAPNMATMLGFIVTDAVVDPLQAADTLFASADTTFNRIVVDGDTSTNDSVFLLANGASGVTISAAEREQFTAALTEVCRKLAQAVVRDGEGATKFITLHVTGAPDAAAARQIANAIGTSPLVKTAFYGGDANWGRIVAAAGRSGIDLDPQKLRLWFAADDESEKLLLFSNGMPTDYSEAEATALVKAPEVVVMLDCGIGAGAATIWTCDLSHDYVSINGHYRT